MQPIRFKYIIFDLDGTLIDSSEGIQEAFSTAYEKLFNKKSGRDIRPHIGPPIAQVLNAVHPEADPATFPQFVDLFINIYDSISYQQTLLYKDMEYVLKQLLSKNIELFIATNKRLSPTNLILDHLSVKHYFKDVFCIDSHNNKYDTKGIMLKHALESHSLLPSEGLMVGDTMHDYTAAKENHVKFAFVNYGYGQVSEPDYTLNDLRDLLNLI